MVDIKNYHKQYYLKNTNKILQESKTYQQSKKGKITLRRYDQSEKGKIRTIRYTQSKKGRASQKRRRDMYRQTKKWKIAKAKRNRNFGWILMFPNPFATSEIVEYHHINDAYVIALPKDLHHQYMGKFHREKTMEIVKQIYLGDN